MAKPYSLQAHKLAIIHFCTHSSKTNFKELAEELVFSGELEGRQTHNVEAWLYRLYKSITAGRMLRGSLSDAKINEALNDIMRHNCTPIRVYDKKNKSTCSSMIESFVNRIASDKDKLEFSVDGLEFRYDSSNLKSDTIRLMQYKTGNQSVSVFVRKQVKKRYPWVEHAMKMKNVPLVIYRDLASTKFVVEVSYAVCCHKQIKMKDYFRDMLNKGNQNMLFLNGDANLQFKSSITNTEILKEWQVERLFLGVKEMMKNEVWSKNRG